MKPGKILLCLAIGAGLACHGGNRVSPMGRSEAEDLRRTAGEWLRLEPVRLLRDYVRIDTTEERGEKEGALFLQRLFDCANIQNEIVCPEPGRCNLLARLPGRTRAGALLLLNHIDVAPVVARYWTEAQPFEGKIRLGYLYGRGAYDMKSIGIAEAVAMLEIKRLGIVPEHDILFLGEADEETGQRLGSEWLLEHRPEWFRDVGAVWNEGGTNEMIVRDVRYWGLETVQAGYGLVEFESTDRLALQNLGKRYPRIESAPVEPLPQVVEAFDALANHLPHPLTDPLRHLDRVRRHPKELAALPDRYGAFLEPRIHWSPVYLVPVEKRMAQRCYVIVSTPPGVSPDVYLAPVLASAARDGIRITEQESSGATSASPYPTPLTDLLKRVTEVLRPGIPFGPLPTFGGTTTSIYFRRRGISAYGYSPIGVNITDEVRRHGNDERIYLRDYVDGVEIYRQAVIEFAFFRQETSAPFGKR